MEKNKQEQEKHELESEVIKKARANDDNEDDPQEHMIEDESPMGWARTLSEEEAAGLD